MESEHIMFSTEFDVFGFGRCKLCVVQEFDEYLIKHPTAHVISQDKEICSLDLFDPKYKSDFDLTSYQKRNIDNGLNTITVDRFTGIKTDPWRYICIFWTDLNGGYDELAFPEVPPDYFGFRSNTSPK